MCGSRTLGGEPLLVPPAHHFRFFWLYRGPWLPRLGGGERFEFGERDRDRDRERERERGDRERFLPLFADLHTDA